MNDTSTSYTIQYTSSAAKMLRKLPAASIPRVVEAIDALARDPRPHGCKKLKGKHDIWRIRVGPYRVAYTIEEGQLVILVVRIAHRREMYDR